MTDDKKPSNSPRSGSASSRDGRTGSNTVFFAIIALIVIGTAAWYALTLIGSEPVGVERAKGFAEEFERECFLDLQDQDRCKSLIGKHHRECLFDNIDRVEEGEGDEGTDIRHDREGYLSCMRERTGAGKTAQEGGGSEESSTGENTDKKEAPSP